MKGTRKRYCPYGLRRGISSAVWQRACFDLVLNKRRIDDKDHYSNKRLKLAGDLMEDLFRISLNRLTRDIKYQLERASMRHRDLSIATAVRADVLTESLCIRSRPVTGSAAELAYPSCSIV